MALAGENGQPPIWQCMCGCVRGVAQERGALLASDYQGGTVTVASSPAGKDRSPIMAAS